MTDSSDNPARPSPDAQTEDDIHENTQKNQDWNRPDQAQQGGEGQRVANDSSTPGYGSQAPEQRPRTNGLDNADDRHDDLGDSDR